MANTVSGVHLGIDTHANRPAASAVTAGTLYSCSDHDLIYRSDGSTWSTWATLGGSAGAEPGNLWTMQKSSSQTLTNNTLTQITFDTSVIDGGGSVIDLANERFVAPATGLFLAFATWLWETTPPADQSAHMSVKVGTTEQAALVRLQAGGASLGANGGGNGTWPLSLTSGDFVTLWINPGADTGVTARGNASQHLASTFSLVRIT